MEFRRILAVFGLMVALAAGISAWSRSGASPVAPATQVSDIWPNGDDTVSDIWPNGDDLTSDIWPNRDIVIDSNA